MTLEKKHFASGSSMMIALIATNFLNFLFNSILGRELSFEDFGLVTLIITFYYFTGIFTTALASTMNFQTSRMLAEGKENDALGFFKKTTVYSLIIAVIISIIWLAATPLLMTFFKVENPGVFFSFAPVFILSTITYSAVGYFQGSLRFNIVGGITLTEPLAKLAVASITLALGVGYLAYLALPFSLLASTIIGIASLYFINQKFLQCETNQDFPKKFYTTALIAGIGSTLFFSVDIMMIRHFFSDEVMGQYSLLSLIGKMVFFFTSLLNIFTVTLSVRMKTKKDSQKLFLALIGAGTVLGLIGWGTLGLAGDFFIPLLFGEKARTILPLVSNYTFAIVLFSLSAMTVSFHIAKQQYIFALAPVGAAVVFSTLIYLHHHSLAAITSNILWTCVTLFVALMAGHLYYNKYGLAYEK